MQPSQIVRNQLWARVGYEPYAEQRAAHDSEERIRLIAGGRAGRKEPQRGDGTGGAVPGREAVLAGGAGL